MLSELVLTNRTIRTFDESRPVTRDDILALIDVARLTASAANLQPLKYRIVTGEECKKVQPLTKWAGALKNMKFPPDGKCPTGFVLICHDTNVSQITDSSTIDVGIAAQTFTLAAAEAGYGCCMIGSYDREKTKEVLGVPENLVPRLLIAIGVPAETCVICDPKEDGDVTYYRDDAGLHLVPKRRLEEIVI